MFRGGNKATPTSGMTNNIGTWMSREIPMIQYETARTIQDNQGHSRLTLSRVLRPLVFRLVLKTFSEGIHSPVAAPPDDIAPRHGGEVAVKTHRQAREH